MKILAVDTSGMVASIALLTDGGPGHGVKIAEHKPSTAGRRNAQTLVSDIDRLLREHQIAPADVDAVAVSIGPGSFTGLRVGLTFAKTFAWINKTPLVAVDTLQALAQQVPAEHPVVATVSDAQRGELFWNEFTIDPDTSLRSARHQVAIVSLDQLNTAVPITGPGLVKHAEKLRHSHQLVDQSIWHPGAATVAQIGAHQLNNRQTSDPFTLEPIYVRRSYAEDKNVSQP